MTDFVNTFLKAARLARKGRPLSAAFAIGDAIAQPAHPGREGATRPRRSKTSKSSPPSPRRPAPGSFITDEFGCAQGTLTYKFYTPRGSTRRRMPIVVMLHGCSQTAADFAAGTGMNRLADELGFLVLYPQQSQGSNLARCWNWHNPAHQNRGGESAVIAGLTSHAIALGRANPARVYIAGLSAGGAAAAIVGAAYPGIFAAVGVHSGLHYGDVRSMRAALSAMRGDRRAPPAAKVRRTLPTIVFHGDQDRVVHPSNASAFLHNLERSHSGPLVTRSLSGRSPGGREFMRRIYKSKSGDLLLEDWTVHGSGHGWSGGRGGSFVDPSGPDASRAMLDFFLSVRRKP